MNYKKVLNVIKTTDNILDSNPQLKIATTKILLLLIKNVKAKGGGILIYDFFDNKLKILSKKGLLHKNVILKSFNQRKILQSNRELAVPVIIQGRCLGVIYLYGKKFSKEEIEYVSSSEIILDGRFKYEVDSRGLKNIFERYVGEKILNKILKKKDKCELEGKKHNCSILFADVNNFTEFTNTHKSKEVIDFLNNYFSEMSEIILNKGGTIDKFVGDSIMVLFGTPVTQKNHSQIAVETAMKMITKMKSLIKENKVIKGLSIGIATGRVVAGNIGSKKMMDYTVIGKKVNLASRITCLAGKNQIFVDETTKNSAKNFRYKKIQEPILKGFGDIKVFEVVNKKR